VIIVVFENLYFTRYRVGLATQLRFGGGIYLVTTLLQIFHKVCRWKNFENRSILFAIWRRYGRKFAAYFFGPSCSLQPGPAYKPSLVQFYVSIRKKVNTIVTTFFKTNLNNKLILSTRTDDKIGVNFSVKHQHFRLTPTGRHAK